MAFFAVGKEQLCANANAEKGFVFQAFLYGLCQAAAVQGSHAVGHGALSWEDDFVGADDGVGVGGQLDVGGGVGQCAGGLGGFEYGMQVAHAVVDDGDVHGWGVVGWVGAEIVLVVVGKDNVVCWERWFSKCVFGGFRWPFGGGGCGVIRPPEGLQVALMVDGVDVS